MSGCWRVRGGNDGSTLNAQIEASHQLFAHRSAHMDTSRSAYTVESRPSTSGRHHICSARHPLGRPRGREQLRRLLVPVRTHAHVYNVYYVYYEYYVYIAL
jgi:hypothetical protein